MRYAQEDVVHNIYWLGLFLGSGCAITQIPDLMTDGDARVAFAVGFLIIKGVHIAMRCVVYANVPRARLHLRREVAAQVALSCAMCAVFFVESADSLGIIGGVGAATFLLNFTSTFCMTPQQRIPLHVEHMAERLGGFVMMMLGQAVIYLVPTVTRPTAGRYTFVAMGLVLCFALQAIYFRGQPFDAAKHAMRRSALGGRAFTFLHVALNFSIVCLSVSLQLTLGDIDDNAPVGGTNAWLLAGSATACEVSLVLIRLTHRGPAKEFCLEAAPAAGGGGGGMVPLGSQPSGGRAHYGAAGGAGAGESAAAAAHVFRKRACWVARVVNAGAPIVLAAAAADSMPRAAFGGALCALGLCFWLIDYLDTLQVCFCVRTCVVRVCVAACCVRRRPPACQCITRRWHSRSVCVHACVACVRSAVAPRHVMMIVSPARRCRRAADRSMRRGISRRRTRSTRD